MKLYVLLIVVMAAATIIENIKGTPFVQQSIYGSWWFSLLWALLVALAIAYLLKRHVRRWNILLLHAAMVVMLLGALLTHLMAYQGVVHLRGDQPSNEVEEMTSMTETTHRTLPFYIRLDKFEKLNHAGTDAAADYVTRFVIMDGPRSVHAQVSMNKIYHYRGIRFYQASYDTDNQGSYLSVNSDPWGIPVTYAGYALLFFSLLWMLFDPKGGYSLVICKVRQYPQLVVVSVITLTALFACPREAVAQRTVPKATADKLGRLCILYNNRICPLETYALDSTKKVYGARSYKGLTAEQVLSGWIFFSSDWVNEPFIKVKGSTLKEQTGLQDYTSIHGLFDNSGYRLANLVQDYYQGGVQDKLHKQATDVDGKVVLVMELMNGASLKVLPYTTSHGSTVWFAPVDSLPRYVEKQHALYIKNVFPLMAADVRQGNWQRVDVFLDKMLRYQEISGGNSLPTPMQYKAERINNAFPFATILFMVNLTLGFLALFYYIYRLTRPSAHTVLFKGIRVDTVFAALLVLSWLTLSFGLALRWIISGNVPLSNGYETMLTVAWIVQLIAIIMQRRFRILMVFGFLLSGFFLLVSHINAMDPAIGQMMPVLNSPLLSVHVSVIMTSYALLSLTFICAVMGLLMRSHAEEMQALSRLFLYPAMTTLGIGIFLGAIWANVSWGTYWSWDPKEVWALITFMVYAVALHTQSLPALAKPRAYHLYMLLAFLVLIMTYFGVNYFLSGMHSYA